jgi:enoyl-CoA hydratase/carnithine racemase
MSARIETNFDFAREPLRLTRGAGRVTLTLDRPHRRNALDAVLVEALHGALDNIDPVEIKMLVIEGAGPSFCSGFDLGDRDAETDGSLLLRFVRIEQLLQRIFRAPYPTVALAQGHAFGTGADLFCACQHRFAAPDTTFRFPGTGFGLALGAGRLASRIGIDATLALLRSARPIDAAQAEARGLVSEIVAAKESAARLDRLGQDESWVDPETLQLILGQTLPAADQDDLATLVRSAARPGLKYRIMNHAAGRKDSQR